MTGELLEQWQIDMNLLVDLYDSWIARLGSAERPLSPVERNGYLAMDYLISMEAGSYGRLIYDDTSEPRQETVEALRVFGLDRYARDLLDVFASYTDPEDLEEALSEMSSDFDGRLEFEAAIAKYMREHAS